MLKKSLVLSLVLAIAMVVFSTGIAIPRLASIGIAEANTEAAETAAAPKDGIGAGIKAIAAALSIGMCAIGTAMAQMKIGGAGAGAIAERPETAAMFIVLVAIPETIVILGFVIAAMLIVL